MTRPPPISTLFPYTTLFRSASPSPGRPLGRTTQRPPRAQVQDRKSTRLNSSHVSISYAVFCLKKKTELFIPAEIALANTFIANFSHTHLYRYMPLITTPNHS